MKENSRQQAKKIRLDFAISLSWNESKELEWRQTKSFLENDTVQKVLKEGARVAVYYPLKEECPTHFLIETLQKNKIPLALPRLMGSGGLVFQSWSVEEELVTSSFGIKEPLINAPLVKPALYIVPLLAYDSNNNRLGSGNGHYDRYFSEYPLGLKIGWAYPCQHLDGFTVEPHDVSMDFIVAGN